MAKTTYESDVFISHAPEDKETVARPLADMLTRSGLRVWLDERELLIDAPLLNSIDDVLSRSRFVVVILSPSFFAKKWTRQAELEDLFSKETPDSRVILPVWHQINIDEIGRHSQTLAGRLGVGTDAGLEPVHREILNAIHRAEQFRSTPDAGYWNVPNRNEYFTGREELIGFLGGILKERTAALTQAITGLGGVGKTQIAVEFCHRNKEAYPSGIFWADASSAGSLTTSYASFALDLGWVSKGAPVDDAAAVWLNRSSKTSGWLLVLDNADEPAELDELIPRAGSGHVLITTRNQSPGWGGDPLFVDAWELEEATSFLLKRGRQNETAREACEELAEALGYLPLALEQAAAYLDQNRAIQARDYLAGFESRRIEFLESGSSNQTLAGDYERTVATTWWISFEKLQVAAKEAITVLAFLESSSVPFDFFQQGYIGGDAFSALDFSEPLNVEKEIFRPLSQYSLVQFRSPSSMSINRLVQEVILAGLEDNEIYEDYFKRAYQHLDRKFPRPEASDSWSQASLWVPHVHRILVLWRRHAQGSNFSWDSSDLWMRAGDYSQEAGQTDWARDFYQAAFDIRQRVLGNQNRSTLKAQSNLASVLRAIGDMSTAYDLQKDLLDLRRKILGSSHPDTLITMSHLGHSLVALGDISAATAIQEEVVDTSRSILGDEHPDTLNAIANLASSLVQLGKTEAALKLQEGALEISRRVLGGEHPDTLRLMANLAISLRLQGDLLAARDLGGEALVRSRRILGREDPHTLIIAQSLSEACQALGETSTARKLQEEVLEVRRRTLGSEHPDSLSASIQLAGSLRIHGDASAADALLKDALRISRRVFGDEHPSTVSVKYELASSLFSLGETEAAQALFSEVLDIRRRSMGPDHPNTIITMVNLASTLRALGRLSQARTLQEEALEVSQRVLGLEHPHTLTVMANLAHSLRSLGKTSVALKLQEKVVAARLRVLGPNHPSTLTTMSNMAISFWELGRLEDALGLHKEVWRARQQALGAEHPQTLSAQYNFLGCMHEMGRTVDFRQIEDLVSGVLKLPIGSFLRKRVLEPDGFVMRERGRARAPFLTIGQALKALYSLALDRHLDPDQLLLLDVDSIRQALSEVDTSTAKAVQKLAEKYPDSEPNPLWCGWMETLYGDKLQALIQSN